MSWGGQKVELGDGLEYEMGVELEMCWDDLGDEMGNGLEYVLAIDWWLN